MSEAATLRYQTIYNVIRAAAGVQAAQLWFRLGGLTDDQQAFYAKAAAAKTQGASVAVARLVAGYFTIMARSANSTGREPAIDLKTVTGAALRGVDPLEVYARPAVTARTAIANGKTFDEAMRLGAQRATALAETDIALAQRAATVETLQRIPRAVGYRRVITGASCQLCQTAANARYKSAQLMPIHAHCDCSVAPIIGTSDPGRTINVKRLEKMTGDPIAVHLHGELGPVLTPVGDHFTGPTDI